MAAGAKKAAKLSEDQWAKLSKIFIDSDAAINAFKVSDDEVAKVSVLIKKANAGDGVGLTDDEVAKFAKVLAAGQKGVSLTDDQVNNLAKLFAEAKQVTAVTKNQVAKLSQELAVVAKKDKKSWSTLKKVSVSMLGVGVGGAVFYGVVKYNSASTTPATSTTSSSA